MAGSRLVIPPQQPIQSTGLPYAGGQLFFYLTGTSTPTPTYDDSGLTTPNTNPVILDSAGNAGNVFLDPSIVYKIVLEDANGNLIWTYDPVNPLASASISGAIWAGVSTGVADAQIVAAAGFGGQPGQTINFVAGFTNDGAMTLNGGTGPLPVYQPTTTGPTALVGNEVVTGNLYSAIVNPNLNSGAGGFQLSGPQSLAALGVLSGQLTPTGTVFMFAGPTPPAGSLANNGAAISRTIFSALFAVIGTTYGSGNGTTTFNVPNDLGRFWRSVNTAGSGIDPSRALGSTQGDAVGPHTHPVPISSLSNTANSSVNPYVGTSGSTTTGNPTAGTGVATENRPANIAYLSCIKY